MTSSRFTWLIAALLGAAGCATADAPLAGSPPPAEPPRSPSQPLTQPAAAPRPPVRPARAPGPPLGPRPSDPEGAIALPCTLRAEVEPTIAGDEVRLRYTLENLADAPTTVTLVGPCPGGLVELRGLPAGYDPMHRCQAGACLTPTTKATYTVPGHGRLSIGGATLRGTGDGCNPPLPLGSLFLQAAIRTDPPAFHACTGATIHIVRDPKTKKLRRAGLLDPRVLATPPATPRPKTTPVPRPTPPAKPTPARRKSCPACAFACPNGIPSRKHRADGCPSCTCERIDVRAP